VHTECLRKQYTHLSNVLRSFRTPADCLLNSLHPFKSQWKDFHQILYWEVLTKCRNIPIFVKSAKNNRHLIWTHGLICTSARTSTVTRWISITGKFFSYIIYLSIHLSIHPSTYLSLFLLLPLWAQSIRETLRFTQFLNLRQSVGILGRGISPSQGCYLHTNTK
jgi:hypothetical protein